MIPWDLQDAAPDKPGLVILGFACDLGVQRNQGRVGAAKGPHSLVVQLAKLACHTSLPVYWAGIVGGAHQLAPAQQSLAKAVSTIQQAGHIPLVMGGGHETAWGHYLGLNSVHEDPNLHIVNFDAHYDLRALPDDGEGHSGTPFAQIANHRQANGVPFHYHCIGIQHNSNTADLFEIASDLNVTTILAKDIVADEACVPNLINSLVAKQVPLYVSLCLDVFAAAIAPGVSAPSPLGLDLKAVWPSLLTLMGSGRVVAFDIVELAPPLDYQDVTSRLAAHLLAEVINHYDGKFTLD